MESGEQSNYYFVSLGCPKNLVDSQVMLGKLNQARYQMVKTPEEAEVIVVNTCSFIQAAKEESVNTILEMADYKIEGKGKCKALVVSGCLAQRYADALEKEMPEVDLFIGTGQYARIAEALEKKRQAWVPGAPLPPRKYIDQPAFIHTESDERVMTGLPHMAYLKISEGCNRNCAFCIIPKLRGHTRSRTIESLVAETKSLAARGVKELALVAQDLTEFGIEKKFSERLEQLLPELCRVEGVEWIRLHYVYPDQFTEELVTLVAEQPKIVKYLDMPIQHTSDRILKSMNRRVTRERIFDLIRDLRSRIPDLVLRTSIIVGFPGETDADFAQLVEDLERLRIDHVGVFTYSKEEGTRASGYVDQVPPSVRKKRQKILIDRLSAISSVTLSRKLGTRVSVRVDGPSEETPLLWKARLPGQAWEIDGSVLINDFGGRKSLTPGELVEVELTEVFPPDYVGKIATPERKPAHEDTRAPVDTLGSGI